MEKAKYLVVLEALEIGLDVELGGINHVMGYTEDDVPVIGTESKVYENGGYKENRILGSWLELNQFLKLCSQIPDEDILVLKANIALTKIKRDGL